MHVVDCWTIEESIINYIELNFRHTKRILENIEIYLHVSFPNTEMAEINEILPCGIQDPFVFNTVVANVMVT